MSWTYSGNPTESDLDRYRFEIGDTIEDEPVLQDAEIEYILGKYTEHNDRMYHLLKAVVNQFSRAIKRSLGPQSEDPTKRAEYFQKMLDHYAELVGVGYTVPSWSGPTCKIFEKGMHDNV